MSTPSEALLHALENLKSEDFEKFKWYLKDSPVPDGLSRISVSDLEFANRSKTVDLIMKTYGLDCIQVTLHILGKIDYNQTAKELSEFPFKPKETKRNLGANQVIMHNTCEADQVQKIAAQYQSKCQAILKEKFETICEKISSSGPTKLLSEVYTELYLSPAESSVQHEVHQIQSWSNPEPGILCTDLFKGQSPAGRPIRRVLTKGVAGVGKTVLTQKFSLDWAEGRTNQELQLLFPFTFRDLNVLSDKFSLVELMHHFFSTFKDLCSFQQLQVLFIFDGLDECRLPLDFSRTRVLTDPTESVSVDVLLVNLIRGSLLPSALLWITTRPAAANQIPSKCVSMVTEIRGFTDLQKELYFRKRFTDQAETVMSHIKSVRSLDTMCNIPIFCWILSTVLQKLLEQTEEPELPRTLTQMYVHFLVLQLKQKNIKYEEKEQKHGDSDWSEENKKMVLSLGKLAYEQLQKGHLNFCTSDLEECGMKVEDAACYSGMSFWLLFTSITPSTVLKKTAEEKEFRDMFKTKGLYQCAVDQALQSPNGHLDLFLRFLLGLSLEENQRLLREYENLNLLHCLNELNDLSLVQEIQDYMSEGWLSGITMSPAQWSAMSFLLLSSRSDLQEFDLRKYEASERALLGLLPVVKASTKALLSGCGLSPHSCGPLASVLSSSSLTHLDLSHNDLQDSGVELLCERLKSAPCRLETLRTTDLLVYCPSFFCFHTMCHSILLNSSTGPALSCFHSCLYSAQTFHFSFRSSSGFCLWSPSVLHPPSSLRNTRPTSTAPQTTPSWTCPPNQTAASISPAQL
ncbi:hypothetical protein WMY93_029591 [Mugilogobius chulae]|uniref:NACHT domain-containing protein n=1 Tax=Mugilogobius chulae TaxID=88201 RepID=A0AAW0MPX4_9GOBI